MHIVPRSADLGQLRFSAHAHIIATTDVTVEITQLPLIEIITSADKKVRAGLRAAAPLPAIYWLGGILTRYPEPLREYVVEIRLTTDLALDQLPDYYAYLGSLAAHAAQINIPGVMSIHVQAQNSTTTPNCLTPQEKARHEKERARQEADFLKTCQMAADAQAA